MIRTRLPRGLRAGIVMGILLWAARPCTAQCLEGCVAIHTWTGEAAGDQFGWVSNDIGDLDLDGITDLVLTAPTKDVGAMNTGRIYVYSGQSGVELFRATGAVANGWLGHDAYTAGDLNADDRPELLVGAPFSGTGRVIIYTYNGLNGSVFDTLLGQGNGDQFGFRVGGGMDVSGDAFPDIVVGAPNHDATAFNAGRAYLYSGTDRSLLCTMDGAGINHRFGSGVALIGDVNGNGHSDILVGAMNANGGGGQAYVYTYDGNACVELYPVLPPAGPVMDFGQWFMNGGEDVNFDGTPDFYVNDFGANRAHIYSGLDGALIWTLSGDGNGQFGIGRIIEDIDGDCHADMLMAAWISPVGGNNAGKAFVYSGADASVLETFTHNVPGAGFGFDANGMGDVDGDMRFDHLITAASDLNDRGRAYLIAGNIDDGLCPATVPALSGWGLAGMTALLVLAAAAVIRRRTAHVVEA